MQTTDMRVAPRPTLDPADVAGFVDALGAHEMRLLAGCDPAGLAERLAGHPPARPVLRLDLPLSGGSPSSIVEAAIAQLATAVAGLWPFLWGGEDFSDLRDDALGHAHLPLRLAALAGRLPRLSRAFAGEMVPRLLRRAAPRVRDVAPELEWSQLVLAFAPGGLVAAVPIGAAAVDASAARALEWLAQHADAAILVLADEMPAGATAERVLFGARQVARAPGAAAADAAAPTPQAAGPRILALPEAEGRPHPQSAVELKLYRLIRADADLAPLFVFNRTVPDLPLLQARADLFWRDGRLVVEIDGPEHRGAAKYRADRHRDFQLTCAGYRVLRMTNEDVLDDAPLALEKIRDMVRLAQGEGR